MKLLAWMQTKRVTDAEMAQRVGDCTEHAVRKWKYGERLPTPEKIAKIEDVTGSAVTLRDFIGAAEQRASS